MKILLWATVVVASAFGQQQELPSAAKWVVPVSLQLSNGLEVRGTGIQVGPGAIIVPESTFRLGATAHVRLFVGGREANRFAFLENGTVLFFIPGLGGPDKEPSFLQAANIGAGNHAVWFVGCRNGKVIAIPGVATIDAGRGAIPDSVVDGVGIGWGMFSLDGRLIAIVRDHVMVANTQGEPPGVKIGVMTQSGDSVLKAVGALLLSAEKF